MKKIWLGLALLLMLSGCGFNNDLTLKFDHASFEADSSGIATISGNVEGEGQLYINGKKTKNQPNKKGNFTIKYKLENQYLEKKIKIKYIDTDDKKNQISKQIVVEPNKKTVKVHTKELKAAQESNRIENSKQAESVSRQAESVSRQAESVSKQSESIDKQTEQATSSSKTSVTESQPAVAAPQPAETIASEMNTITQLAKGAIARISPFDGNYDSVRIYIAQSIKYTSDSQKQEVMDSFCGAVQRTVYKYKNHYSSIHFYYDGGVEEEMGQSKVFDRQQYKLD